MVSLGTKFKNQITKVLNNRNIRSTATFIPNTITEGSYGGYEGSTETAGTNVTVNCIPADYFGTKFLQQIAGNFNSGDVRLIIKGDETVDREYTVTWQSETYDITDIKPLILNNIKVAIIVALSKVTS